MRLNASHFPAPIRPFLSRTHQALVALPQSTRDLLAYLRYRLLRWHRTFDLGGTSYRYRWDRHMRTWTSERAVELPIAWRRVREADPAATLEVGNVLRHYYSVDHPVVDKYEQAEGVLNEDVVDFTPPRQYDLIVSVSTLEHVGWDEEPRDEQKVIRAIEHLRSCLTADGELIVTWPMGYNQALDRLVREGRIPFAEHRCLARVSADKRWREVDCDELAGAEYGSPYPNANGLTVGVIRKA